MVLILTACNEDSDEGEITLKVADSFPTTNILSSEGIVYFMDRVEELTDGDVTFDYFPAEQIGDADEYLNLMESDTIDIGYTSYATDKLPLTEVSTLPGAYETSEEGTEIFWELMEDMLIEEEYEPNGIRPIYAVSMPPYQLATKDIKIEKPEDVKDLKMRATGTIEYALDELGASSTTMAAPEAYTAVERGTVDGVVFPFTSFEPYQMDEIIEYSTENAMVGSFNTVYSINEDVYQDLPEEAQEAMDQAGEETMNHLSKELQKNDEKLQEEYESSMEIIEFDEEEIKEWEEITEPAWDKWAKNLEKQGMNAEKTVEKYKEIQEKYNK